VEVRLDDGTLIILDAGTGIRDLGLKLQCEGIIEIHLLLSHYHLDHLIGLGFFSLLHDGGVDIHIWGPGTPSETLEQRISRYLSPPLFPVRLAEVASRVTLHDLPDGTWTIGGGHVTADFVSHNGLTLGYRIEEGGRSIAYIPDHEPALEVDLRSSPREGISGYRLAAGADVLLHDAQYTVEEYARRVGWGHSSLEHAVTLARRAMVGRLVLFHHDPAHSDSDLDAMEAESRRLWGSADDGPVAAREGMEIEVGANASGRVRLPQPDPR
jgi:ribonuclease BN (tRNA processing enzyme)